MAVGTFWGTVEALKPFVWVDCGVVDAAHSQEWLCY
jgi:hypothetical protein